MLHSLGAKLNRSTHVGEIAEAVTVELRSLVNYHNCRVFILQPDGETLLPEAFRGELTEYQGETVEALRTKVGRGITGYVALTRRSYYSPNANDDPYAITIPGTPDLDESMLAVPVVFGERLIGVIVLSKVGIDQFDDEDMRVLEIVASHAAVAIENAWARAEIERALETEREATARLQALDQMKDTFLQAVSHDLRTPLTVVMGNALTLEREDLDLSTEDRRDLSHRLAVNARKLDHLLSNLLDLERLLRGVVEPHRQSTDVAALVHRLVEETDFGPDRRITVQAKAIVAEVDAAKLECIVENLLLNAVKHTPEGTPIKIRVETWREGVLLVVDDEGPGVPPTARELIFEPFRQGAQKNPSPGSGVGLALVARFSELHGGRAWVEDAEGGGASFRVWLPLPMPESDNGLRAGEIDQGS
jgi:K+-sensing histidine kinase KdpD